MKELKQEIIKKHKYSIANNFYRHMFNYYLKLNIYNNVREKLENLIYNNEIKALDNIVNKINEKLSILNEKIIFRKEIIIDENDKIRTLITNDPYIMIFSDVLYNSNFTFNYFSVDLFLMFLLDAYVILTYNKHSPSDLYYKNYLIKINDGEAIILANNISSYKKVNYKIKNNYYFNRYALMSKIKSKHYDEEIKLAILTKNFKHYNKDSPLYNLMRGKIMIIRKKDINLEKILVQIFEKINIAHALFMANETSKYIKELYGNNIYEIYDDILVFFDLLDKMIIIELMQDKEIVKMLYELFEIDKKLRKDYE